jgi:6-phosphofructo-2-kinase/fructose-2,6-biphosphatase 4
MLDFTSSADIPEAVSESPKTMENPNFTTITTHTPPNVKVIEKPQMCEINPGIWDGLSPEQARKYYPEEWDRFAKDPYAFRAPRAESYHDLCGEF